MEFDVIKHKLLEALKKIVQNDPYLLEHAIHEPTISHRLAVYLESEFPGFNVDCEYNGNIDAENGKKYIYILKQAAEELGLIKAGEDEQELLYRCIIPDIIVHKRGHNGSDNNLLVIEVKKSSNPDDGTWDAEKLSRFTSAEYENNFNYQYGMFVRFTVGTTPDFSIQWYQNGHKLP